MIDTILLILLFWAIFFGISVVLHYIYITKSINIKPWSYFDQYPFACYKCMTTWALVTTYIMAGILLADVTFTLLGITLSFCYGFGLNKREKERFVKDEDNE